MNKAVQAGMKKELPQFSVGDTVNVSVRIIEGEKERIQIFTGTVIARRGSGMGETFTVRRIVNNEGVERIFPIQSPRVAGVEVVRAGKTRRAKLHFLRDRVGKSTRLKDIKRKSSKAASPELSEPDATEEAPGEVPEEITENPDEQTPSDNKD